MAGDFYSFHSDQQQKQFQYLIHQFRCVVCQDQSLASSTADIASEIKIKIAQMVRENDSNQKIKNYLTSRYSNFILLKPPLIPETYFLWFAPWGFLLVGCVILFRKTT